jgi:hypothetical protein
VASCAISSGGCASRFHRRACRKRRTSESRTRPATDPGGQVSEVWDIEALNKEEYRFAKPAIVRIKLDAVDLTNVRDDQLLRVASSIDGNWEVLGNLFFDRVRNEIRGTTSLLRTKSTKRGVSAFTILRSDRLPDGGIPMETDAGPRPMRA